MAADNYSDVVQALAKQIVDGCMQTLRKNLPGMVKAIPISADQIEGEVTNINSTNLNVDVDHVAGLNQYVAGMIGSSRINPAQIGHIDPEDGRLYLDDIYIRTAQVSDFEAQYATMWVAEINKAEIQTALIDALHAGFADIANAQISQATIDMAQVRVLEAVSAEIADLLVKNAKMDFAQIRQLGVDDVMIGKGMGGKLYIADLAVTEANMVSLTVGELIVKGEDGGFYAVLVDDQGNIRTERKTVANDDLGYHSVTGDKVEDYTLNGDMKMIEGSITARTLNVQEIFAQNAMIMSLIAQHINVDELFANEAFIGKLMTTDISSNTSLRIALEKLYDDTMAEVSIRLSDESIISTVTGSPEFSRSIDMRTRTKVTAYYAVSDDGQNHPGDDADWQTEIPETDGGEYLWTKTVTEYYNGGAPSVVYYVTQFGSHGTDGIVVRITSDNGFTYREPEGELTLTADVYAGGSLLSNADVNALGCIQWFKNDTRIPTAQTENWHQLVIDLSTVGERAVYRAALMG